MGSSIPCGRPWSWAINRSPNRMAGSSSRAPAARVMILSLAGFVGTGWQLDLSVDFLASGNGNMTLSNPGMAGVIGLVVIFTSTPDDPADADLDNAVIHFHGWYAGEIMEGIEVFQNGVSIYDDYEDGDSGTGENWFGYDMDNDTLYVGDSGFPDPWAYT